MVNGLSSLQCRVAREALRWTQKDLAERSKLSLATVKRFELGHPVHEAFGDSLRQTFVRAGIVFYDEGAVIEGRTVRFGLLLLDP